jgi:alkylated DNA nucleotide flippase Atl1
MELGFKEFSIRVIEATLSIPKGKVTTYGRIARAAGGGPMSVQSISGILWRAHMKGVKNIPWHRIVYANGKIWLEESTKNERLALHHKEGIAMDEKGKIINFEQKLHEFL